MTLNCFKLNMFVHNDIFVEEFNKPKKIPMSFFLTIDRHNSEIVRVYFCGCHNFFTGSKTTDFNPL